jgi:hypothetical protein
MESFQSNKPNVSGAHYLIFLRRAIKEGYKPTLEEKALLKKYQLVVSRAHPRSGFAVTQKMGSE